MPGGLEGAGFQPQTGGHLIRDEIWEECSGG